MTLSFKPENITGKPNWTAIFPLLPVHILFVQCCDITEGGTNWIFLISACGRQYWILNSGQGQCFKTKNMWGYRLIDSVSHCACGPDNDGYDDEEEEDDDDEAQVECYIPDALHLFYMRYSKLRFPSIIAEIAPQYISLLSVFFSAPHWHHSGDSIGSAPLNEPLRIAFESPQLHRCWLGCLATGQHRDHWRKPPPLYQTQTSVILELFQ